MRPLLLLTLLMLSINAIGQRRIPESAFGATVSFPWVNNFAYYDYNKGKPYSKSGFVGLGGSVFYKDQHQKLSLSLGLLGSIPVPFGPYDYEKKNHTLVHGTYLEATYHKRIHPRINLIGGLHYMEHAYSHWTDSKIQDSNFP